MVDVQTAIVIDRPVDQVSAFAMDPGNATAWYVNIKSVVWKSAPPLRVGSLLEFSAEFLGRRLSYVYEVTEIVPSKRFVMRTAEDPFPMETTYSWESVPGDRSRMTLRNRGKPSGFGRLVAPLMSMAMRRANRKDLVRLKALLEAGPARVVR